MADKPPQDIAPARQIVQLLLSKVALANQTLQSLKLFLRVLLVGTDFLEDLDVVLSIFVFQSRSSFLGLLNAVTVCGLELGDDSVKRFNGATSSIETATDRTVSSSIGVDELDEVLLSAGAFVGKRFGRALLEVFDSWVRGDTMLLSDGLAVLCFSVDFSD